ncbi:CPBP family intramembrane glutamic endopeptidase [Salinigranum salinum]|uniref:CPBP family intramembrane glutamic endopeptidase n=1 Tax=Salinigranum salinum TaxID=1364937 RepID=UPI0012608613|nr:CPBP family intramembrane glutamic endopeptidase [Salinigranum salinum]
MSSEGASLTGTGDKQIAGARTGGFSTRLFVTMLGIGSLGIVGYIPFASAVGLPSAIHALQAGLLFFGAFIGARYARSLGLGAPFIEAALAGTLRPRAAVRSLVPMVGVGVGLGIFGITYNFVLTGPLVFEASGVNVFEPIGLPLSVQLLGPPIYGGITEEIIFRFGFVTGAAILVQRVLRAGGRSNVSKSAVLWTAIIIVDIPFALEHLVFYPVLTPAIVAGVFGSTVVLGTVFGWLYWKRGLEAAMVVHLFSNVTYLIIDTVLL